MKKTLFIIISLLGNLSYSQITGKEKIVEGNYFQTYPENNTNTYNSNWRENYLKEANDLRKAADLEDYRYKSLLDEFEFILRNFYLKHQNDTEFCDQQADYFESYVSQAIAARNDWLNNHEYINWNFVYLLRRYNDNIERALEESKHRITKRENLYSSQNEDVIKNINAKNNNAVKMISNELFVYDYSGVYSEKRFTYKSIIIISRPNRIITIYDNEEELVYDIIGVPTTNSNKTSFLVIDSQGEKITMTYECGIFYFKYKTKEFKYSIEDDCGN